MPVLTHDGPERSPEAHLVDIHGEFYTARRADEADRRQRYIRLHGIMYASLHGRDIERQFTNGQFIIARGGWSYPAGSIIGTIYCIPIEEHLFFILQPILIVLLHSIFTHSALLPFRLDESTRDRLESHKSGESGRQ
jgi:lycopene cyclase domain-containing protein